MRLNTACVALAVAACVAPATAGMLVVEQYGLGDVAARGGWAIVGKVLATRPGPPRSTELELLVDAVHGPAPHRVGERARLRTYGGVEWTDEHKSPKDRRLRGEPVEPVVGAVVVAVPAQGGAGRYRLRPPGGAPATATLTAVELRAADAPMLRRLPLVFDEARRARYRDEAHDAVLGDLADPELVELAAEELRRRGLLDAAALARADRSFLAGHLDRLSAAERARLAAEILAAAPADRAALESLVELLLRQPGPELLPALRQLATRVDPAAPRDGTLCRALRAALGELVRNDARQRLELTAFAEPLALIEVHREGRPGEPDLAVFTSRMTRAARTRVAVILLEQASKTASSSDGPSAELLEQARRLAREAPAPAILDAMATVDPMRSRYTQTQEETLRALVDIALAVSEAQPRSAARARAIVDGWLARGVAIDDDTRRRWRRRR